MFGCNHKYGKVISGYQYCDKCGKAIAAPLRNVEHIWEEVSCVSTRGRLDGSLHSETRVLRSKTNGEIKKVVTRFGG